MAIASNMLNVHQLAGSKTENLETQSEAVKKAESANTSKTAAPEAAASKLEKKVPKDEDGKKSSKGIFSDIICCKMPSISLRLPKFKLKIGSFKKFNFDLSFSLNICGKEKTINPLDAAMKVANFVRKNPGILSPNKEKRLEALLKSDLLAKSNILGLGRTIPTCVFGKTIGSLYGSDTGLGPSLRSRNSLKTLLHQDPCTSMFANQPLVNKWLSNSNVAALISTVISGDKEKAYSFVDACLGILGQRDSALGSLALSLAYSYDYNTRKKLWVTNRVLNSGKLTSRDFISLKANSNLILNRLDKEREESGNLTTNPNQDFKDILNVLNKLDPSWSEGNNFSKTSGNQTMKDLANGILLGRKGEINLTGKYTTKLQPEHHIGIINAFHCCTSCSSKVNVLKVRSGCCAC